MSIFRTENIRTIPFLLGFMLVGVTKLQLQAQGHEVSRTELPMENERGSYVPVSLEEEGILLYRELETRYHARMLELTRLDTTLAVAWRGMLQLKNHSTCMSAKRWKDQVWILCRNEKAPFDCQVYSIQVKDGRYEMINLDERDVFTPLSFTVGRNFFLIGGEESKRPVFRYYSLSEHRSRLLSGFDAADTEWNEVTCDEQGNIDLVLVAKKKHHRELRMLTFNAEGDLIAQTTLSSPVHNFYFTRLVYTPGGKKLLFGTYQKTKGKIGGIFSAKWNDDNVATIVYYDFQQLKHFYKGTGEMSLRHGNPSFAKSTLYLQKPSQVLGHYLVIAHGFRPFINRWAQAYEGRPSSIASARLDSSQYRPYYAPLSGFVIHRSLILNFNEEGKLLYDDSFPLRQSYTQQLDEVVNTIIGPGHTFLVTVQNNQLMARSIDGNQGDDNVWWRPEVKNAKPGVERKISLREFHPWYKNYSFCVGLISNTEPYTPVPSYQFTVVKLKTD